MQDSTISRMLKILAGEAEEKDTTEKIREVVEFLQDKGLAKCPPLNEHEFSIENKTDRIIAYRKRTGCSLFEAHSVVNSYEK